MPSASGTKTRLPAVESSEASGGARNFTSHFFAPVTGSRASRWRHLDARDPVTGAKKWDVKFRAPPLASLLSTAGNLVFVPDAEGILHAYDAQSGKELWSHDDGTGHDGGIISYSAGGKQYIAVTAGWGGMATDDYPSTFGEPFKSMPKDTGALIVYSL